MRALRVVVIGDPPPAATAARPRPEPATPIAFVLHTSGTTGVPKAVPYRQARLAERTRVNTGLCGLGPGAVYATASPFHHIAGFGNHAVALAAGAALAPVPRFTVEAWHGAGRRSHVTHALTVPTMLEILLDAGALALPSCGRCSTAARRSIPRRCSGSSPPSRTCGWSTSSDRPRAARSPA